MSDVPTPAPPPVAPLPVPPPTADVMPPPGYAGYTRGAPIQMGSPEKLEALAEGYSKLSLVFLCHILWVLVWLGAMIYLANANSNLFGFVYLVFMVLTIPVVGYMAYGPVSKVGFGLNWSKSSVIVTCVMVALVGIIGYAIVQSQAATEIKRYGIKLRFFGGFRKKDIKAAVKAMRASPYYQAQAATS